MSPSSWGGIVQHIWNHTDLDELLYSYEQYDHCVLIMIDYVAAVYPFSFLYIVSRLYAKRLFLIKTFDLRYTTVPDPTAPAESQ